MYRILLAILCFIHCILIHAQDEVSVNLDNFWIEHNVEWQNQNGMCIHCDLEISGMKGKTAQVVAYFFDEDYLPLKAVRVPNQYKTRDSQLCTGSYAYCKYETTYWEDYKLFIPYNVVGNCVSGAYAEPICQIAVSTKSGVPLAVSEKLSFEIYKY